MFNDVTPPHAVTAVLWLLGLFSVASWSVILAKGWHQWRVSRSDRNFTKRFWQAADLRSGCRAAEGRRSPVARLCQAGAEVLGELDRGVTDLQHSGGHKEILERTLRQQLQREQTAMEGGLTLLASVGSISPFIGLFGTVWGIMHALESIAASGASGLSVVAGPVGEALIATAFGIATAIPAVLAYNLFLRRVRVTVAAMEHFATDFLLLTLKPKRGTP